MILDSRQGNHDPLRSQSRRYWKECFIKICKGRRKILMEFINCKFIFWHFTMNFEKLTRPNKSNSYSEQPP